MGTRTFFTMCYDVPGYMSEHVVPLIASVVC